MPTTTVRLSDELLTEVDTLAHRERRSRSEMLRVLLEDALALRLHPPEPVVVTGTEAEREATHDAVRTMLTGPVTLPRAQRLAHLTDNPPANTVPARKRATNTPPLRVKEHRFVGLRCEACGMSMSQVRGAPDRHCLA